MATHDITDFGAVGDGERNDAGEIQKALDACMTAGGGRVVIPGGRRFAAGPIELRSNVELHLEAGATLAAIPDRSLYLDSPMSTGPAGGDGTLWLHAKGAEGIAVTGTGVIDGMGKAFMTKEGRYIYRTEAGRPFMVNLEDCTRTTFRDGTLRDAPFWAVHPLGCRDMLFDGVRILNDLEVPISAGSDPNRCKDVRIVGCHIESGDDCVCPKSEAGFEHYGGCESISVVGCTLVSTSCAIKIGSSTWGEYRNLIFDGCVIHSSHRGFGIQFRDEGLVDGVVVSDMTIETRFFDPCWWGDATPIYVTAFPRNAETKLGTVSNVRFSNIHCNSENGVYVAASAPEHLEKITFDGVSVELTKRSKHPGGRYDRRPCVMEPGVIESPTSGFHIENARDVTVRNCDVAWGDDPPDYYRHAVYARNVPGLSVEGLKGDSARPGEIEAVVTE